MTNHELASRARVKRCVEAGSIEALFPLLKDWPKSELEALIDDIEGLYDEALEKVDGEWARRVMESGNFLDAARGRTLDKSHDDVRFHLLIACSDIQSVALYCLGQVEPQGEEGRWMSAGK